jgi:hypothetical protein
MSLLANKARIVAATQELRVKWMQTKETWRDDKSREFEAKYIEPLAGGVTAATEVIDQLEKLMNKVRSDCE